MNSQIQALVEAILGAAAAIAVGVADAVLWHRFGLAFDTALVVAGFGVLGIHVVITSTAASATAATPATTEAPKSDS